LDAGEGHVGRGGELVEGFARLVAPGELVVGQSHVGEFDCPRSKRIGIGEAGEEVIPPARR
jgi:hypothetical protein